MELDLEIVRNPSFCFLRHFLLLPTSHTWAGPVSAETVTSRVWGMGIKLGAMSYKGLVLYYYRWH
jgi:hypothetical protein